MHLEFERSIWAICEQEKHSLGVETDYFFFFSVVPLHCPIVLNVSYKLANKCPQKIYVLLLGRGSLDQLCSELPVCTL